MKRSLALGLAAVACLAACRLDQDPSQTPATNVINEKDTAGDSRKDSLPIVDSLVDPPHSCTLAGCEAPLVLDFDTTLTHYQVFLSMPGWDPIVTRCDIHPGDDSTWDNPCHARSFSYYSGFDAARDSTASVIVLGDCDRILFQGKVTPTWSDPIYPNGPTCDPVCYVGRAHLHIGAAAAAK